MLNVLSLNATLHSSSCKSSHMEGSGKLEESPSQRSHRGCQHIHEKKLKSSIRSPECAATGWQLAFVGLAAGCTGLFLWWQSCTCTCIVGAWAFRSELVRVHPWPSEQTKWFCTSCVALSDCDANMCLSSRVKEAVCFCHSHLCVVLPEQVTLPVPFTIWKHFRQADIFNILNAFLQILLQQLPLLLLLVQPWRRAAVLLDSGAGQRL